VAAGEPRELSSYSVSQFEHLLDAEEGTFGDERPENVGVHQLLITDCSSVSAFFVHSRANTFFEVTALLAIAVDVWMGGDHTSHSLFDFSGGRNGYLSYTAAKAYFGNCTALGHLGGTTDCSLGGMDSHIPAKLPSKKRGAVSRGKLG
jgi:hypothetical protein